MDKYNEYVFASRWIGACVLVLIGIALPTGYYSLFYFIPLIAIPVGIMQLLAGIHFVANAKPRADWFDRGIRRYWWINAGYFLILIFLYRNDRLDEGFYYFWLIVVPWGIAIYQYVLVSRLRTELVKRQELALEGSKKFNR